MDLRLNQQGLEVCRLWFMLKSTGYGYTIEDSRHIWKTEIRPALIALAQAGPIPDDKFRASGLSRAWARAGDVLRNPFEARTGSNPQSSPRDHGETLNVRP